MSDIPEKRAKIEDGDHEHQESTEQSHEPVKGEPTDDLTLLSKVEAIHVLSESGLSKTCIFSGRIRNGENANTDGQATDDALFILERTPIDGDEVHVLQSLARDKKGSLRCVNQFVNDAYSSSFVYQAQSAVEASEAENGDLNGSAKPANTENDEEKVNATESPVQESQEKHVKAKSKKLFNAIKLTRIYPAESSHFEKYAASDYRLLSETYEDYTASTLPLGLRKFKADWIFNILEGRSEQERIIHSDADEQTGYVVIPDMKCVLPDEVHSNPSSARNLYALAIARRRDLHSLRDLDGKEESHLQLLQRINSDGVNAVAQRYGVARDTLVAFVHYPPSFYHLHVHIVHVGNERLNAATIGRGMHVLDTVISNLQHFPTYYRSVTLSVHLKTNDPLFAALTRPKAEAEPEAKKVEEEVPTQAAVAETETEAGSVPAQSD